MKQFSLLTKITILLICLLQANQMNAQRALSNVTGIQLPDLPKLSNGSQAWGDYDNDKLPDLFISGTAATGGIITRLYHNTGNGFEDKSSLLPNLPLVTNGAADWGNYDNDNYLDLLLTGNTGNGFITKIYHNTINSFAEVNLTGDPLPGVAYGTANWADLNDEFMYIFITGQTSNGAFSGLFECTYNIDNPGNSIDLKNSTAYFPGLPMLQHSAVTINDFNKDGTNDFAMTGDDGSANYTRLYLSTTTKGWVDISNTIAAIPQLNLGAIASADFDGDGLPDIVMTGNSSAGPVSKLYQNVLQGADWNNFQQVSTGIQPVKRALAAWSDYDKNGRPDLMMSGIAADGSLSGKLYSNTTGGFQDVSSLLLADGPMVDGAVSWGDYNNDGWPDLWYSGITNYSDTVLNRNFRFLENKGNGSFNDSSSAIAGKNFVTETSQPVAHASVSWVDYLNSGKQDMMITGQILTYVTGVEIKNDFHSFMFYYIGDGKGKMTNTMQGYKTSDPFEYWFPLDPNLQVQDGTAKWADYNGDGYMDLLYTGKYVPSMEIDKSQTPSPVFFMYKNTGKYKSYMEDVTTSVFPNGYHNLMYTAADWGDFNKDGWIDLIITGSDGKNAHTILYKNNGGNNFSDVSSQLPNLPQLAYGSVQWGDYDLDGRLDLVISGKDDSGTGYTKLYHNTISGFADVSALLPGLPGVYTSTVSWVDYNNDGLPDLHIAGDSENGPVSILYQNQGIKTSFTDQSALLPDFPSLSNGSAAFADYDNDGRQDLYLTGQTSAGTNALRLYHNLATGFERSPFIFGDTAVSASSVAWADYDNDSWKDLMVLGNAGSTAVTQLQHNISPVVSSLMPNLPNVNSATAAWADYDNDGLMDVMITGSHDLLSSNNILYHNTGNGFEDQTSQLPGLPNNYILNSAAWADYDNDGLVDLVVSGYAAFGGNGAPKLYHNVEGSFEDLSSQLPNIPTWEEKVVSWIDYDSDGRQDLLFIGNEVNSNSVRLYHNTINGFVDVSSLIPADTKLLTGLIAPGDFNSDGYTDFAVYGLGGNNGTLKLFYNNLGAGFIDTTSMLGNLNISQNDMGVAWGDYDNDTRLDLFINGSLFHNDIYGFSDVTNQMPGLSALKVNSGNWLDFDNDGWRDLLVADTLNTILYRNTGSGFESITLLDADDNAMTSVADYDNDGRMDILKMGQFSLLYHNPIAAPALPMSAPGAMSSRVNPNGTSATLIWTRSDYPTTDGMSSNLVIGTTPGGHDIISPMTNPDNGTRWIVQAGNVQSIEFTINGLTPNTTYYWNVQYIDPNYKGSPFGESQQFTTPAGTDQTELLPGLPGLESGDAAWGDYDNDGKPDLFVFGKTKDSIWSGLYRNTGSGFENKSALLPALQGIHRGKSVWVDYDNDGKLDLLAAGRNSADQGVVTLHHNTGNGFEDRSATLPGLPGLSDAAVAYGDYDNDGFPDLLISGYDLSGTVPVAHTRLFHNKGNGNFEDASALLPPGFVKTGAGTLDWIDIDRDGRKDIFLTGDASGQRHNRLYRNTGNGFTDISSSIEKLPGIAYGMSAWFDYDMDGYPDLFVAGQAIPDQPSSAISRLYHNNKGAGFTDETFKLSGMPGLFNGGVAWGDVDQNGWPDLMIGGTSHLNRPVMLLYSNTGNGFSPSHPDPVGVPALSNSSMAAADYDNDGRLDLILFGNTGREAITKLLHNPYPARNRAPKSPGSLSTKLSADGKSAILTWKPATDGIAPGQGLNYNVYVGDQPEHQNIAGAHADIRSGGRLVPETGNAQGNSFILTGIVPGKVYYWSVQSIDPGFLSSPFAKEQTFITDTIQQSPAILWGKITAENEGDRNRIGWNTLYEEKGDWFVVEKMILPGFFLPIEKQPSTGKPSSYLSYDKPVSPGQHTYRIRIYSRDGRSKTSQPVTVRVENRLQCELNVFPNPVRRILTVTINCRSFAGPGKNYGSYVMPAGTLTVINNHGQTVMQLRVTGSQTSIDMSRLPDGLYYIRYSNGEKTEITKVLKQ